MQWLHILWLVVVWLRKYAVTLALMATLVAAMAGAALFGAGPMPQQPPQGYVAERGRVSLSWSKGTREEPITLQISIGDPGFSAPIVDKEMNTNSHSVTKLERGATYYWRLIQDGHASPTTHFQVSRYNARF
jgi:hypothetical protein